MMSNDRLFSRIMLAVKRPYYKAGSPRQTDYHRINFWGKVAERMDAEGKVGLLLWVCGTLENRLWMDEEGKHHKTTEVSATQFIIMEGERADGSILPDELPEELPKEVRGPYAHVNSFRQET